MIGIRTVAAALACAGAVTATPIAAQWTGQYSPVKPGDPVPLASGGSVPPGLLKRTRKDDVSGATRVVIPFFQVQFVLGSKASSNRSYASLSQAYTLDGVEPGQMQAIADRLYDKFVADLSAQGLTVVPLAEAQAKSPALAKLLAAGKPAPFAGRTSDGTTSTIVSAHGTPVYFHIGDPQLGSMANIGSRAYWDQPAAARELDAALVGVRIGMNFVEQKSSDKRGFMGVRGNAKVTSAVGLSIEPVTTHLWIQSPKSTSKIVGQPIEPVRYYLTAPLVLPDGAVLDTADTTTRGAKRSDAAATAVGMLLGGGIRSNKHRDFVVTVDPARFDTDVGGAMTSVESAFAAQAGADLKGQ